MLKTYHSYKIITVIAYLTSLTISLVCQMSHLAYISLTHFSKIGPLYKIR